jgi:hypothetical protein
MFKNFMHNELEISKEDIREWVKEACKEEARKLLEDTYGDISPRTILREEVKHRLKSSTIQEIKNTIAVELTKELEIKLKN